MSKAPVRVAVTGAAGQIGYALLFRIASGQMLGPDQPVILQMLELPMEKAQQALKGVMMELEDCAFPLLAGMVGTDDPKVAFKDASCPSGKPAISAFARASRGRGDSLRCLRRGHRRRSVPRLPDGRRGSGVHPVACPV